MAGQYENEEGTGVATQESEPELKEPPLYKVFLINDDYTPMDFVVEILERFFSKNRQSATKIMVQVHTEGKGTCGLYTYEIAETKVDLANLYSREHQHPLLCTLEKA